LDNGRGGRQRLLSPMDRSGYDSETHSAAPLRSALTVSDSLGGARRVLALFNVVGMKLGALYRFRQTGLPDTILGEHMY
jgi:hypothetical protein